MDIIRITARWDGFQGAPGYSNFHFSTDGGFWDGGIIGSGAESAANTAAERVSAAFELMSGRFSALMTISIEPEAIVLDSDTGEQLGFIDVEADDVTGSQSTGGWSGATGAVVNWRTNDYRDGRRIRGRTFLVPLNAGSYANDGTLSTNGRDDVRNFADHMVGSTGGPEFGVWSRPRNGSGGVFATVTSSSVPDMAAVLRSRRD